jgi:TatD DNase family protein
MSELSAPRGFDFHCHIDLYPDPPALIASCEKNKIVTLAVTTTPKAWPQNRKWAAGSTYVHTAVGLHPEVVGERHRELALLEEYVKESRLIGEIGLDGSPQYRKSWEMQNEVFIRALMAAQGLGGRVVSIHSRRAANEVVKCLREHTTQARVLPILHWFSGSIAIARKAADMGCYFSVNRGSLEHETGVALVRSFPVDRLLTETDGPFTLIGERKSEPEDVVLTAKLLAETKSVPIHEMRRTLANNSERVLAFAGLNLPSTRNPSS